MRLPIGSRDVSTSGGNAELIGRQGDGWQRIADTDLPLNEAIALLDTTGLDHVRSGSADAGFFTPGQEILWQYARYVETARVIRDDARGLVVWIPAGSERLEAAPADGRRTRDVPMDERFSVPWVMRQSTWTGQGVVRVAPSGKPWSVWFFRQPDGSPAGAYINLELPHRRESGETSGVISRDLVLDLMVGVGYPGSEDIWLKDADELVAAVQQGRFTAEQAEAVRSLADHAGQEFVMSGGWPLDEGWDTWAPDAAMDVPVALPVSDAIDAARLRSGRTSLEG